MAQSNQTPSAYLKAIWRWKLLFLVFLIGVPAIAYGIASRQPKKYQSAALLQESPQRVDTSLSPSSSSTPASTQSSPQELGGEARVIETTKVATIADERLHPPLKNPQSLLGEVKAVPSDATGLITVTGTARSSKRAADIANAFADAVVTLRAAEARDELTTTIARATIQLNILNKEVARATKGKKNSTVPAGLETQVTQLAANLQELKSLRLEQGSNAQVVQAAQPENSPVSPRLSKITILGLVGGLLAGIAAVFTAEAFDRKIRYPEQLEALTQLPSLGVIPRSAFGVKGIDAADSEQFQMLRSALMYFNVDQPLSTIVVASPLKGDGKTTVAVGLAVAAAEAGQNVILVDADLRRPRAADVLHVAPSEGNGGLAGVLLDQTKPVDALIDVPLHDPNPDGHPSGPLLGRLRLLPAVAGAPNPSELLASQRMRRLVTVLNEVSSLVIIDTSPLLAVSDAWPLADIASGVVVVSRLEYTSKAAIRRLTHMLANTNATVIGTVATGATRATLDNYGYGYRNGYKSEATSNGHRNGSASRRQLGPTIVNPNLVAHEHGTDEAVGDMPTESRHATDAPQPFGSVRPARPTDSEPERAEAGAVPESVDDELGTLADGPSGTDAISDNDTFTDR